MSLRTALIIITLIDIVVGGAAIGIGITAFIKMQLELSLAAYCLVNIICFIFAVAAIFAIAKKHIKLMKIYFTWKCLEVLIIPIFELLILFVEIKGDTELLVE
jgi:hypothetical protein